jgi:cytochrome P450
MTDAEQRAREAGLDVVNWDVELDERFRHQSPTFSVNEAARLYSRDKGMFFSNAARGFFVMTKYDYVVEALSDAELYCSSKGTHLFLHEPMAHRPLPMEMDPPEHTKVRQLLAPFFTPSRVQGKYKDEARNLAVKIISEVAAKGSCDAIQDLGEPIAAAITLNNMGVDPALATILKGAVKQRSLPKTVDEEKKAGYEKGVSTIRDLFVDILAKRREKREDDIPSALLDSLIDGKPLADDIVLNLCCTVFSAGVHTTSTQLGFAFYNLARNPSLRQRLVDEPKIIVKAIEELMRYEAAAVLQGRTVTRDVDFHGLQLRAGDRLILAQAAANRDPEVFSDPDQIDFDRTNAVKQVTLGRGPHRCIGSYQAKMILQIALEEWHARIPEYTLGDMSQATYELSCAGSISQVPLVFEPQQAS